MRWFTRQVARQLQSASARYRHDLAHPPPRPNWLAGDLPDAPGHPPPAPRPGFGRRDERLVRVEAILLLSREPLSSRRLCQYANLADATEARTLVRQLNEYLDARGRAFRVEEVAGGFQLLTRPKFATWLRRLANVPKELRLSAPALETLAVIAYRQPASRSEIEAVRGVNCGEVVRQLLERDLVRIAGRSDDLGRPYLYATTRQFLQLFGLRELCDLPRADRLRKDHLPPNLGGHSTDTTQIRNSPDSTDRNEEEIDVTATIRAELSPEELRKVRRGAVPSVLPRASDDDEVEDDKVEADDDEEFEELDDDEDDDFDDDDEEDDDEDEFDDVDDEEGFEEEEWEEVDDDEEEDEEEEGDDEFEDDEDDWDDDEEDDEEEEEEEDETW